VFDDFLPQIQQVSCHHYCALSKFMYLFAYLWYYTSHFVLKLVLEGKFGKQYFVTLCCANQLWDEKNFA